MLIRLFPENPETPTILFSLAPPSPTSNIPLPSYYNSQLETLGSYGLPPPRSVYALDKAGWALALLEEVVFDLGVGKVGVKWVDGGIEEWEMEEQVNGRRSDLRTMLANVVKGVKESEQRREDEKREELVVSLLQSIPVSAQTLPPQTLVNNNRPSSRILRRLARSNLLDAFRIHVVHHLAKHYRHRSSYPLWIARRCLESLMAEYAPVHDLDDDEESLGTDETFEDSMDMDMDGESQATPNTSVDSITPCEDPEPMDSSEDVSRPSDAVPSCPACGAGSNCQECQSQNSEQLVDAGGFDPEADKENAGHSPQEFVNNNPYPSFPPAAATSGSRLPLSETDFEVTPGPVQPNAQPAQFPIQLPPPSLPPQPRYNTHPNPTFLQTVHLHTLISHLEYEEDRARAYLDPETNPDNHRFRSGAAGSRGRKQSSLRRSFTIEDLIPVFDPAAPVDHGEDDCDIEAVSAHDGHQQDVLFEVEQISSLNPPAEPIFSYESESEDGSDYDDDTDDTDGEGGLYLSTPPTSEDESSTGLAQGHAVSAKKPFFIKRKPSPRPDSTPDSIPPSKEAKRVFFSTVPLPTVIAPVEEPDGVPKLVDFEEDEKENQLPEAEKMELDHQAVAPAPVFDPFSSLGLLLDPSGEEVPAAAPALLDTRTQDPIEEQGGFGDEGEGMVENMEEVNDDEDFDTYPDIPDEANIHAEDEPGLGYGQEVTELQQGEERDSIEEPVIQAEGIEMGYSDGAPSHSYDEVETVSDGKAEHVGEPVQEEDPEVAEARIQVDTGHMELTPPVADVKMDHRIIDPMETFAHFLAVAHEFGIPSDTTPSESECGDLTPKDQDQLKDESKKNDDNAKDIYDQHDLTTEDERKAIKDNTDEVLDDQAEVTGLELAEESCVDRLDGETEFQPVPEVTRDEEGVPVVNDSDVLGAVAGDVEDLAAGANSVQHPVEQGWSKMDTCSEEVAHSEQGSSRSSSTPEVESDSDGEMFDIDLDDPGSDDISGQDPSSPVQDRPSSPAPFISPRSLGASAPAVRYDFEWGKHSPLARLVVLKNWNNPMDSDEMY